MEGVFVGEKKFYYEHHLEGRRCLVVLLIVNQKHLKMTAILMDVSGIRISVVDRAYARKVTDLLKATLLTALHALETLLTQLMVRKTNVLNAVRPE